MLLLTVSSRAQKATKRDGASHEQPLSLILAFITRRVFGPRAKCRAYARLGCW